MLSIKNKKKKKKKERNLWKDFQETLTQTSKNHYKVTLRAKLQFSIRICSSRIFAASDPFDMFKYKDYRCLDKVIHEITRNRTSLIGSLIGFF